MTLRNWHWLSVSANATGAVLCLWALSVHPEWAKNLGLLVGWMLLNGAVSTKALRGKV